MVWADGIAATFVAGIVVMVAAMAGVEHETKTQTGKHRQCNLSSSPRPVSKEFYLRETLTGYYSAPCLHNKGPRLTSSHARAFSFFDDCL
jgi:hypothetical protein